MKKHSDEPEFPQGHGRKGRGDAGGTNAHEHTFERIGKAGKPPASKTIDEGHPLGELRVVLDSETDEQHEKRRKRLLAQAAEADAKAGGGGHEATHSHWEAARLRGLAGSALWHAEADAAEAGYTDRVQTIGRTGRFYVVANNPATGDRLAWKAGVYKSRGDLARP